MLREAVCTFIFMLLTIYSKVTITVQYEKGISSEGILDAKVKAL